MKQITYKGIRHNVLNDAPFIGAILIAKSCERACPDCINAHLKTEVEVLSESASSILKAVGANSLNEGIILSGLEWSEQPEDLMTLVTHALQMNMKVMVYTHHKEANFFRLLPQLSEMPVFIKFGAYIPELTSETHYSHGVKLATSNQYIKYFGE